VVRPYVGSGVKPPPPDLPATRELVSLRICLMLYEFALQHHLYIRNQNNIPTWAVQVLYR